MENIQPNVVKLVAKEMQDIMHSSLEGVQVLLNDQDVTDVQALIDGPPGTPYASGQFRVKLHLSNSYPRDPPKGYFLTKIFHPNIAPNTGEICVNTMKKDWTPELGIKHLLLTIKCLLIVPNPESALNEEAGRLLLEDYDEYARRARLFTEIHAQVTRPVPEALVGSRCAKSGVGEKSHAIAATSGDIPGTSQGILRDTNSGVHTDGGLQPKKHMPDPPSQHISAPPPAKKSVSAAKKALKRL